MNKKILSVIWLFILVISSAFFHAPAAAQSSCSSTSSTCMGLPVPKGCPSGFKWSLTGSGLAHCVAEDPVCNGGTILEHDTLGNPSCIAPPICTNGAIDYPLCRAFPTCLNGALDPPTCRIFPEPPINGGRPYTHIIDTGASLGNNHCNSAGGFVGDGDSPYTKWEPWLLTGKLTPNTIDGVAVTLLQDNCGQGISVAFDSRLGVNPKRQHFKSLTVYDSPLTTTWVWGKAMDWFTYKCDSPGGENDPPPKECSTMVVWGPRGVPVRMQPYSRYYINVIY
ncbi:hypothetical protein [Janthinobacterium sp. FW305-128]|uniref:hypothetical protein n=1 Tax=Janthinobacterium sp. FW305-128 TaxID=2775055 RepID=UPI001E5561D3|nr:hypothetical protein [Janthinobacterium sp. FW305-128]MCC7684708.1 hypothetical protein [Janthinobacterium sp. FW305-128]